MAELAGKFLFCKGYGYLLERPMVSRPVLLFIVERRGVELRQPEVLKQ